MECHNHVRDVYACDLALSYLPVHAVIRAGTKVSHAMVCFVCVEV